ncbi:HNH endonuclease [Actinokineospora iranica]|uniref:5-methylcytosine-specific restriction endonuclease McrA n=1 Tax=Actinokineospora iranica TaxID=1271860 RepID=A0A1G6VFU8_9PSEU|nr:HNH endonuclease [Actinokineospora iranica]SDD51897.1 5-methylcytosine-specific restriction endonuclease McrA [Actinokineospora iranica]
MPDRQPTRFGAPSGPAPRTALCPEPGPTAAPARAAPSCAPLSNPPPPVSSWGRRRVLLLNTTFEPLTALSLRRAVVLVVCGKAEVVHGDPAGMVVHSATSSVVIPSVIRLSSYVRVPYRGRVPLTRAGLMHRDRYRCAYCGGRAETIDHVVPRSRGGQHTWQNCVACCAKCNHRKADKLLSELGWRLRVVPTAPRGPHWRLLAGVVDADPLWLPYLGEPAA